MKRNSKRLDGVWSFKLSPKVKKKNVNRQTEKKSNKRRKSIYETNSKDVAGYIPKVKNTY